MAKVQDVCSSGSPGSRRTFLLLCAVSGLCVLAFETIWIRTLAVTIGSTVVAATLVICAFFLFAAIGNGLGGCLAARVSRPLVGYALCEAAFAAVSVGVYLGRTVILGSLPPWPGEEILARQCGTVVVLVGVPSLISGMSFPFVAEAFIDSSERRTGVGGGFYAAHLAGAAVGVLLGGLVLPFCIGYRSTVLLVGGLGAAGGLLALVIGGRSPRLFGREKATSLMEPQGEMAGRVSLNPALGWGVTALSGGFCIGIEGLVFQYFRLLGTGSIYSVTVVMMVFIAGLGAGATLAASLRRRGITGVGGLAFALWCAGTCWILFPIVMWWVTPLGWVKFSISSVTGMTMAMLGEALLLILVPAMASGLVFPMAWDLVWHDARQQGLVVGWLVMLNKLAAACGAIVIPFMLVPWLGLPGAVMSCGVGYLLMGLVTDLLGWRMASRRVCGLMFRVTALIASAICLARLPSPVAPDSQATMVAVYQGAGGIVAVTDDSLGSRHIVLDQHYVLNGTGRAMRSQQHESWIPLFLHGGAKRVMFIGMASGISASAALDFPVEQLTAVEIVPEVAQAAREHFEPWSGRLFRDPRASVMIEDGRMALDAVESPDVIIMDLLLPGQEGTADLYSRDFFREARDHLAPGGLFCLWVPSYQHDAELSGILIRTFLDVFPCVILVRNSLDPLQPVLGLVGSHEKIDWSDAGIGRRLGLAEVESLATTSPFFRSVSHVRLILVGDLRSVEKEFTCFPVTTDDRPWFAFRGAKTLVPGSMLRGTTLLEFYGRRFLAAGYPSLALGTTGSDVVLRHIRAGNYAFAAAVAAAPLPDATPGTQRERLAQAMKHLERAQELAPGVMLEIGDLGK